MNVMVQMKLRNSDGVLERILGKMRFRGVQVSKLLVDASDDGHHLNVTCKLVASPRLHQLNKQLRQMFDVQQIEVYSELAIAQ